MKFAKFLRTRFLTEQFRWPFFSSAYQCRMGDLNVQNRNNIYAVSSKVFAMICIDLQLKELFFFQFIAVVLSTEKSHFSYFYADFTLITYEKLIIYCCLAAIHLESLDNIDGTHFFYKQRFI